MTQQQNNQVEQYQEPHDQYQFHKGGKLSDHQPNYIGAHADNQPITDEMRVFMDAIKEMPVETVGTPE